MPEHQLLYSNTAEHTSHVNETKKGVLFYWKKKICLGFRISATTHPHYRGSSPKWENSTPCSRDYDGPGSRPERACGTFPLPIQSSKFPLVEQTKNDYEEFWPAQGDVHTSHRSLYWNSGKLTCGVWSLQLSPWWYLSWQEPLRDRHGRTHMGHTSIEYRLHEARQVAM